MIAGLVRRVQIRRVIFSIFRAGPFLFLGRYRAGFDIHGTVRQNFGGTEHALLYRTERDPFLAGFGNLWSGRNIHGTPRDGTLELAAFHAIVWGGFGDRVTPSIFAFQVDRLSTCIVGVR